MTNVAPPEQARIFILAKTYQLVSMYFAHWQDADLDRDDLDTRFQDFLPRVVAAGTRLELALAMSEFLAPLNNSHTLYRDRVLMEHTPELGFSVRPLAGEWVVTASDVDELRPGDVVTTIQGRTLDDWYLDLRRYTCAKSELARTHLAISYLVMLLGDQPIEVGWQDAEGRGQSTILQRSRTSSTPTRNSSTEGRWLRDGEVYYLRIPSFSDPSFEERALELLEAHSYARCLVIDVRGNTGGSTPLRLIRKLMHVDWRPSRYSTPAHLALMEYLARHDLSYEDFEDVHLLWRPRKVRPEEGAYSGQLILLVDYLTGSASEDFVIPFKDNGRALIVGEHTWGSTGQPYMQDFGHSINLFVGTKRDYLPDGSQIEGRGIEPDVTVELTRQDLYQGIDPALERSLDLASEL